MGWVKPLLIGSVLTIFAFIAIIVIAAIWPPFESFILPWSAYLGAFFGAVIGFTALGWAALLNSREEQNRSLESEERKLVALARASRVELIDLSGHVAADLAMLRDLQLKSNGEWVKIDKDVWRDSFYQRSHLPKLEVISENLIHIGALPEETCLQVYKVYRNSRSFLNHFYEDTHLSRPPSNDREDQLVEFFAWHLDQIISARSMLAKFSGDDDTMELASSSVVPSMSQFLETRGKL